jgi:hypothetical protein
VTLEEYHALIENGILGHTELLDGRLLMGEGAYEVAFSPQQMRAAHKIGLSPRSYIDVVLDDAEALAELRRRLDSS